MTAPQLTREQDATIGRLVEDHGGEACVTRVTRAPFGWVALVNCADNAKFVVTQDGVVR